MKEMDDRRAHIIGSALNLEKEGPLIIGLNDLVRDVLFSMQLLSERASQQIEMKLNKSVISCLKSPPLHFGENSLPPIEEVISNCRTEEKAKKMTATQLCRKSLREKMFRVCLKKVCFHIKLPQSAKEYITAVNPLCAYKLYPR